jgi:hypothetical protein
MQIVTDDMIKILPNHILQEVVKDRLENIKEGKSIFARWIKSRTTHNKDCAVTQDKPASPKSAKAGFAQS